ncbi:hypothetical protein CEXT_708571 [Caerostris extrusa]|uniref:Uncharacterized protein n=1 Tax=Caerostris extrusa TaxID=172846 RepID=A0AAV4PFK6_CAEEX|nr:hypothetical protein CEXT_708571 [Caerostris extrusa]
MGVRGRNCNGVVNFLLFLPKETGKCDRFNNMLWIVQNGKGKRYKHAIYVFFASFVIHGDRKEYAKSTKLAYFPTRKHQKRFSSVEYAAGKEEVCSTNPSFVFRIGKSDFGEK